MLCNGVLPTAHVNNQTNLDENQNGSSESILAQSEQSTCPMTTKENVLIVAISLVSKHQKVYRNV